jgi:hypothetical protein
MLLPVHNAAKSPHVSFSMLVAGHDESSFSESGSSDECAVARPSSVPTKRRQKTVELVAKKAGKTTTARKKISTVVGSHTVNSVLATWDETSEYGKAFRAMAEEDRTKEVLLLNKGSAKGMKGMIKNKVLSSNFKLVVADKLRDHHSIPHGTCGYVSLCSQNEFVNVSESKFHLCRRMGRG